MDIQKLIQIAEALNLSDKANELRFYAERLESSDKDLILPLVGEFSSGKTTLINSLLDNPNLETASRATTASIFEIRFGAKECSAMIVNDNGMSQSVDDVADIKNDGLQNVEVVKVFDTSRQVGSSTVLVDTPGLSSNDPAHKIALSSYLPNADAILLLIDVNQQVTRSLVEFLNSSKLANKPIYAVITKCDTKTPDEVALAKAYLQRTIEVPFSKIVTISSTAGDMAQFDEVIAEIQANKNAIVENSIRIRVSAVAKEMSEIISKLLKQGNSTKELDEAIDDEQDKLDKLNRNIDSLLSAAESRIDDKGSHAISQFSKSVFTQVDGIVKAQGRDCSDAVNAAVNSAAVIVMQNFQKDVMSDILSLARSRQGRIEEVPMGVLETIDIAENAFNGFSAGVDLSNAGHEFDKKIGYGLVAAVAIGATIVTAGAAAPAATAATGGTAASAAAAGATSTAVGSTGAVIAADIATDVAATAYTTHKMQKLAKAGQKVKKAKEFVDCVSDNMETTQQYEQELGHKTGMKRGFIETSVGWITEFFAKPARQRAVNDYINGTLVPEFRQQILSASNSIFRQVSTLLRQEAESCSDGIRTNLQSLKASLSEEREKYANKIKEYKQYLSELNEI